MGLILLNVTDSSTQDDVDVVGDISFIEEILEEKITSSNSLAQIAKDAVANSAPSTNDYYEDNPYFPMEDSTVVTIRYIFAVIYSVLFMIGLANVLVLFIVARFERMRTVTNVFIFNLCLADLVYVTFLPFVVCFQMMRSWIFGEFMCKLFFIAESTTKFASVYFVCVLSVDRYLALCHPSWCKRNRNLVLAILVSGIGWFITAALMTPIYLYSTVIELAPDINMCTVKWPMPEQQMINQTFSNSSHFTSEHYFAIYSFIFCFGAPAIVIIMFYFKVFEELIRANDRAVRLKRRKEQTYKKVTRMVLAMVTFYFICWSPYWIMSFISTFVFRSPPSIALRILFNIIHTLPYLNCSANPILYSLMTETFQKILREIFPCMSCFKRNVVESSLRNGRRSTTVMHCNSTRRLDGEIFHADDEDDDESRFIKTSFSHSVRMVSNLSINLTALNGPTSLSSGSQRTTTTTTTTTA